MPQGPVAMQSMVPTPSAGIPSNYPYAVSGPLPQAVLRPLQQCLFDTEYQTNALPVQNMIYFQRAQGQAFASAVAGAPPKTHADTNLTLSGTLANPTEFSIFGFNVEVQPNTAFADFNTIYTLSAFTFLYTGNRQYLQVPLSRIPQGVGPSGYASTTVAATTLTHVVNGSPQISNYYRFTMGRAALRIRPTENFQVIIDWPWAAPAAITADTRIRVYILGLMFTPL